MTQNERANTMKMLCENLTITEMRLAVFLLAHHNDKARPDLASTPEWGCCWPSTKLLLEVLGLSKVTLSRAKTGLVDKGILRVAKVNGTVNKSPKWLTPALTLSYQYRQLKVNSTVNSLYIEDLIKEAGSESTHTTAPLSPKYIN